MHSAPAADRTKVFNFYDENKDGKVTFAEFKSTVTKLGGKDTDAEIQEEITKMDKNGDTVIELNEVLEHQFEAPGTTTGGDSSTATGSGS